MCHSTRQQHDGSGDPDTRPALPRRIAKGPLASAAAVELASVDIIARTASAIVIWAKTDDASTQADGDHRASPISE